MNIVRIVKSNVFYELLGKGIDVEDHDFISLYQVEVNYRLQNKLDTLYREVQVKKGFQTQQVWSQIGEIKKAMRYSYQRSEG